MTLREDPTRPAEVRDVVLRARSGQQARAHQDLVALSADRRPVVAWTSAAAALGWYWWNGANQTAAELVERVVLGCGPQAGPVELPEVPEFVTTLAAAAYYDGIPAVPRLQRMLAALPADHDQAELFLRVRDRLDTDPASLLPVGISDPEPMFATETDLAARDPRSLSAAEAERLYLEAANCGQRAVLLRLVDAGHPVPARSWALNWTGQVLAEAGRPAEAQPLFIASGPAWAPSAWWQTMPWELPLGPTLRPWVSAEVRQAFAETPIAPGWN
jgi:hypothetical protein